MARAKKQNVNNTINIKSLPVQCHIGASKFVNDDWGTMAFSIPRNQIQNKFADPELRYNFIYFLFGYENSKEVVYVGQAKKRNNGESVLKRLREHDDSKTEKYRDKWAWIVAVTNKNDAWGLDDLNALEHAFYNEIPTDQNLNGNNPNSGGADYEAYTDKISQIKSLITAVGFSIFSDEETTEKIQVTSETNEYSIVEDLHNGMARIPEIVTPQKVVKAMVDMLPQEVWNSKTKFLDLACKGGEYLREVYDRLMETEILQSEFPNAIERSNHILKNQIYGIALSQVSLERTTKKLLGEDRNIRVIPDYINKLKGNNMGSRPDGSQQNIMDILNKEFGKDMKFDVVIGNPPYQENNNSGASAIYAYFIDAGLKLARYECMIVPARWIADKPNGIEKNWLDKMRGRKDFIAIHDFVDNIEIFRGVQIAGGVCYFLIDTRYTGECEYSYHNKDCVKTRTGYLQNCGESIVRDPDKAIIVNKVLNKNEKSFKEIIGTTRNFSPNDSYFGTNYDSYSIIKDSSNYLRFFGRDTLDEKCAGYVSEADLAPGTLDLAKMQKIFIWRNGPSNEGGVIINKPFVGGKDSLCSRSFVPVYNQNGISALNTDNDCINAVKYLMTKFARFLISCGRSAIAANREAYRFIPLQDFTSNSDIDWSQSIADIDQQLYKKYNLTEEEIAYIEQTIKPMA